MTNLPGQMTNDTLRAVRTMCGAMSDDTRIAAIHGVAVEQVIEIRKAAKRRGRERTLVSHHATGANLQDTGHGERVASKDAAKGSEEMLKRMIETGMHWLTEDRLRALCAARGWTIAA